MITSTYTGNSGSPADLIRWGQDGLAFHTAGQLYVLQGPIVKDNTSSPADVSVSVAAPAAATTGTAMTWTITVSNLGPNTAQGVTVNGALPAGAIFGSIQASQGACSGNGEFYCDLGSIASGSTATVTITATPTDSATLQLTAKVASVSYDPISTNNVSTASTTVTGAAYNPPPAITQLVPSLIQSGSSTFVLTVDGEGFTTGSSILWNGQSLSTTFLSSGQLTASIDSSKVAGLGWAAITVSTPTPGGGTSTPLPFTIYQVLNVPASAMAYDPFTRKLYATLPSTATTMTGNSIVAIDPASGNIGSPINVGSEPNLLSETSDGNYFYVGLSGAKALGRFNLLNQTLDLTVPLPTSGVSSSNGAAIAIATVPGSDSSLAVEKDSFDGIGILDISGNTGTFRTNFGFGYSGDYPVFADATHFYAYDSYTTGAEFYRYSVDSTGVHQIDGTTLEGMGGFGGRLALDGGIVFGAGGAIVNPSTTPPSQIAVLPLGTGCCGTSLSGGGVIPYAAEARSFNIGVNTAGTWGTYLERFDTQHATLEQMIPLPASAGAIPGATRWGQDGLALILSAAYTSSQTSPNQILLIQGPFVLPAEIAANSAPSLNAPSAAVTHGAGNTLLAITGTGFLPGATVFWNGSGRTTNFVDSGDLNVAIPASDLQSAATITLTAQNPGSSVSNSVTFTVQ